MTNNWPEKSFFYHIYPLGFCGAPASNDFHSSSENRLSKIYGWIEHFKYLGINALYLGPLLESSSHGYDTADYFTVDRRLGTNEELKNLIGELHKNDIKVILDGVFNHVGREFGPFIDLKKKRENSIYKDWFSGFNPGGNTPFNDSFGYDSWEGHYELVKLNLKNGEVVNHLLEAAGMWIREFDIDGLRLDVAYSLDHDFLTALKDFCLSLKPGFWIMGELIHGDYSFFTRNNMLDSSTNYECYKGLYSSHADANYFEIAWSLNRLFGNEGIYKNFSLYNFADNHDVNRVASSLSNPLHLYPLYILLFTMPGIPSIYYGSEWGIEGMKNNGSDSALRPDLNLDEMINHPPRPDLPAFIKQLAEIRSGCEALQQGNYSQVYVSHKQFVFSRKTKNEEIIIIVSSSETSEEITFRTDGGSSYYDLLNDDSFESVSNSLTVNINPCGGKIIRKER